MSHRNKLKILLFRNVLFCVSVGNGNQPRLYLRINSALHFALRDVSVKSIQWDHLSELHFRDLFVVELMCAKWRMPGKLLYLFIFIYFFLMNYLFIFLMIYLYLFIFIIFIYIYLYLFIFIYIYLYLFIFIYIYLFFFNELFIYFLNDLSIYILWFIYFFI